MPELFAIYIHWPFCTSKCPYCDFNSHVSEKIAHDDWLQGYKTELDYFASLTKNREVTSVFFGGGTPSLMLPETVEGVINHIQKNWKISPDVEITLEANPTSIESQKFKAFQSAGINRVSIGVQAFDNKSLHFLGRQHDALQAIQAIESASHIFDRFSFDLIYARPSQTLKDWETELGQALEYAANHLSLYQLTIEKGTPFYIGHQRGDFLMPNQDLAADFYELTQAILSDKGFITYEVSNHAQIGHESLHNLTYWRYEDYLGVGPGAHGRLTLEGEKYATRGHRAPDIWLQNVLKEGSGQHPFEQIGRGERFREVLMMGLRIKEGVAVEKLNSELDDLWHNHIEKERMQLLINEGFLEQSADRICPTIKGMQCLNSVLGHII